MGDSLLRFVGGERLHDRRVPMRFPAWAAGAGGGSSAPPAGLAVKAENPPGVRVEVVEARLVAPNNEVSDGRAGW